LTFKSEPVIHRIEYRWVIVIVLAYWGGAGWTRGTWCTVRNYEVHQCRASALLFVYVVY